MIIILPLVIHEVGHVTAALIKRVPVPSVSLGMIQMQRLEDRWWITLVPPRFLFSFGTYFDLESQTPEQSIQI